MAYDVITLAQKLISFPSVTPKDEGALPFLAQQLEALGFECHLLPFGDGDERVLNLFARKGNNAPHLCYAGHTDVVPVGDEALWKHPPFDGIVEDGVLYGRGASDMKGSVAAFVAAVSRYLEEDTLQGSVSLLITGDEEGSAINGTVKVLEWMEENGQIPDLCLVGEPTNPDHLGQFIKTGRRGSLNAMITAKGQSGHVAHPNLADNPIPKLVDIFTVLNTYNFDDGTEHFQPSHLESTTINAGEYVDNMIPDAGRLKLNIRFNDLWSIESLVTKLRKLIDSTGHDYEMTYRCDAGSTVTAPNDWTELMASIIEEETGERPAYTTGGATSDARFIGQYCPTVEFGVTTQTMHQIDECVSVEDLQALERIFERLIAQTGALAPEQLLSPTAP